MLRCLACNDACNVKRINISFGHVFGYEERYFFGSACCEDDVFDDSSGQLLNEAELISIWNHNKEGGF